MSQVRKERRGRNVAWLRCRLSVMGRFVDLLRRYKVTSEMMQCLNVYFNHTPRSEFHVTWTYPSCLCDVHYRIDSR